MNLASTSIRRLRAESGSAMVVAMGAMSVILLLSAWAAGSATQLSGSSQRDRASKQALPATEAGIRQATYKLNNLAPAGTDCPSGFSSSGSLCTKSENAGNGVQYDYWMTKAISSGTCAGFNVAVNPNLEVRCVTVEATSAGQSRRAQARLVRSTGSSLFPFPGIFGDRYVILKHNSNIKGTLGSNDLLQFEENNCIRDGLRIGKPGGRVVGTPLNQTGCSDTIIRNTAAEGPFVLTPVEFGSTATENSNVTGWSGTHTYNVAGRNLSITGNSFTFSDGDYNVCSLHVEGATIYIPTDAHVRIFIDDETRGGSNCPLGSGSFTGKNAVTFQNPGPSQNLQIYMYGSGPIEFKNTFNLNGFLHAPNAPVVFKNVATITGGLAAQSVEATNTLNYNPPNTGGVPGGNTVPVFYRTAWTECTPARTTSGDPASGC